MNGLVSRVNRSSSTAKKAAVLLYSSWCYCSLLLLFSPKLLWGRFWEAFLIRPAARLPARK